MRISPISFNTQSKINTHKNVNSKPSFRANIGVDFNIPHYLIKHWTNTGISNGFSKEDSIEAAKGFTAQVNMLLQKVILPELSSKGTENDTLMLTLTPEATEYLNSDTKDGETFRGASGILYDKNLLENEGFLKGMRFTYESFLNPKSLTMAQLLVAADQLTQK